MLCIQLLNQVIKLNLPKSQYPFAIYHAIYPAGEEPIKYYKSGYDLIDHQSADAAELIKTTIDGRTIASKLQQLQSSQNEALNNDDDDLSELALESIFDAERANLTVSQQSDLLLAKPVCQFDVASGGYCSMYLYRHHQPDIVDNKSLIRAVAMHDGTERGSTRSELSELNINQRYWLYGQVEGHQTTSHAYFTPLDTQYYLGLHMSCSEDEIEQTLLSFAVDLASYASEQHHEFDQGGETDVAQIYQESLNKLKQARKAAKQAYVDAMPENIREYYQYEVDNE